MTAKGDLILQKLSSNQTSFLGLLAGAIEVTLLQPILYCKNTVQQNIKITLNPRVMYRGLSVSILNMSICTGIQFPLTSMITKTITGGKARRLTSSEQLIASFSGGFLSGVVGGPLELILIQQQRFGGNILKVPATLVKNFGPTVIGRAMHLCSGREGLWCAGYLGITPVLSRYLNEVHNVKETTAKIYASVVAGLIAAPLSHPLDTMKTGMQGDVQRTKYGSTMETYRRMYDKEGGPRRFFNGLFFRAFRMVLGIYIINECKLRLAPLIFNIQ